MSELRVPPLVAAAVGLATLGGAILGAMGGGTVAARLADAVFFASAFAYLSTSLVDFAEHLRLDLEASGRIFSFAAISLGESVNHAATTALIVAMLVLVGPVAEPLDARGVFTLAAPALFLGLGWRDELVYHRRRCAHREDIMHTVAHLAGTAMLAGLYASRLM